MGRCLGRHEAAREIRYSQWLADRGVRVAAVLAAGQVPGAAWMVSRAVEPATPLDAWHNARAEAGAAGNLKAVRAASKALAELVARMHDAGVLHHDLHTGNVLVQGQGADVRLTLMDLHRVSRRRRLSRRRRAANLAQLLHDRRHLTTRSQRLGFLQHYLRASRAAGTLRGWQFLIDRYAEAHTRTLYAARDRRVFRRNKYFARLRTPGGWRGHVVLASKRRLRPISAAALTFTVEDWQAALADPAGLFDAADAAAVKDSPSSLVVRRSLSVGEHTIDVYVKRHRRKRLYKVLLDACRPAARPRRSSWATPC